MSIENNELKCEATGKIMYSKRKAGSIINSYKRHHFGGKNKVPKRCYYCTSCHTFHITHTPFIKASNLKSYVKYKTSDK